MLIKKNKKKKTYVTDRQTARSKHTFCHEKILLEIKNIRTYFKNSSNSLRISESNFSEFILCFSKIDYEK